MEEITGDHDHDVERDRQEDTVIGSPSSDQGKMVIKLKIPKLVEGGKSPEGEVNGILSSTRSMANEGKRVCPECKKEFSSGKALGGHMRVHVQAASAANKNPFLKPSKTTKFKRNAYQGFNNGGDQDMKKEQKPYYLSSVNDEGKPTCSQCGKTFPSMKSLFGHMRCHPERIWRGILPPTTTTTNRRALKSNSYASSSSSLSGNLHEEGSKIDDNGGDQVVDLTKFLRGWSVTERRGRKALKPPDEEDDEVLLEAVEDLMSLAQGGASMAESDVTQRQLKVDVFEGSNSINSLTNNYHKIDENSPSINLRVMEYDMIRKGKAVMEDEIERKSPGKIELDDGGHVMIKNFSDNESESRNTNEELLINYKYKKNALISPYKSPNKMKKRKKMKLMMELEQNPVVTGGLVTPPPVEQPAAILECKYKCTTCNKCFTSHQALGGHRSSHNKLKTTSTDHHQTEADDYDSFLMNHSGDISEKEVEFSGDAIGVPAGGNNIHQCRRCAKIFATGQALGGHQRCHWTGTFEAQAPSSQITSTGEAASQTGSGRKVLDFDLNEIPPAMMEDEAGNGNGYASSSYNSNMV